MSSIIKIKPDLETACPWVGFFYKPIFHLLLIVIVGLIAYSNTFHVPFQFDDTYYIINNPIVKDLSFFFEPSKAENYQTSFGYHTLKMRYIGLLTFALNYRLHGLDITGYHVVNLTIHIINALLVYWLVLLTLQTPFFSGKGHDSRSTVNGQQSTNLIALFSALLFVAHPVQTQAVTYIVQRFTLLATMFYLLSLAMYVKFRMQDSGCRIQDKESKNRASCILNRASFLYLASVLCAVLAMKTKEIAFTLPIIIVLYEFSFFSPNSQAKACGYVSRLTPYALRFLYLTPFLLTMLIIPLSLLGIDKPIGDFVSDINEATRSRTALSRWDYLFTQFRVIVTYIRLLSFPVNQNLDYNYPIYNSFLNPNVFLSFLFLLVILGFGVYLYSCSKNPPISPFDKGGIKGGHSPFTVHRSLFTVHYLRITAFGIFWFFITLSVESSIIPTRDIIFEHRLYLPSIGLIIAFVSAIFHFISYFSSFNLQPSSFLSRHASRITVLMLATFVVVSPIATYQRNIIWQDDITLWSDVIRKSPLNARGYNNLGGAFAAKGLTDKAIENYQIAVRLKPDFGQAHYNLGVAFGIKGLTDLLIEHLQIALKLEPDYPLPEAYYNLGIAYESKSLLNLAAQHYRTALMFRPDFTEAHDNYGVVLFKQGSIDEAIKEFQIALKIKPDYARAIENLQNAYIYKESKDKNKF